MCLSTLPQLSNLGAAAGQPGDLVGQLFRPAGTHNATPVRDEAPGKVLFSLHFLTGATSAGGALGRYRGESGPVVGVRIPYNLRLQPCLGRNHDFIEPRSTDGGRAGRQPANDSKERVGGHNAGSSSDGTEATLPPMTSEWHGQEAAPMPAAPRGRKCQMRHWHGLTFFPLALPVLAGACLFRRDAQTCFGWKPLVHQQVHASPKEPRQLPHLVGSRCTRVAVCLLHLLLHPIRGRPAMSDRLVCVVDGVVVPCQFPSSRPCATVKVHPRASLTPSPNPNSTSQAPSRTVGSSCKHCKCEYAKRLLRRVRTHRNVSTVS